MTENDFDIKQPAPKSERSAFDLTAFAKTLAPITKKLFGKKGFMETDILVNWDRIVGKELADFSFPQKIEFKREQKNNGVLHLQVQSGAFALEIAHRERFIIEKINAYFGYNAVSGIKIIQNSSLPQLPEKVDYTPIKHEDKLTKDERIFIEEMSSEIKNSKLKEILIKLGHSIFNDNHSKEK